MRKTNTLLTIIFVLLIYIAFKIEWLKMSTRDYQIETNNGYSRIYDGNRLVGVIPYDSTSNFWQVIDKDNE